MSDGGREKAEARENAEATKKEREPLIRNKSISSIDVVSAFCIFYWIYIVRPDQC